MTQRYFRGIGQLPFQYFGFANEVYKILEKTKQIQKLENIYQLGSIKDAYNSEHRRSEYLKIQIALITKLTYDSKGKGGLSSKFKAISFKPSRAEVLQSLVILHNIGHMQGTFCNEAGLLYELRTNNEYKSIFKKSLKSKIAKELFEQILKEWDINNFYKVLIYFNLSGLGIAKEQKTKMYEILDWYFDKNRAKDKIDDVYKLIRIISFLYLDLENSFIPLSLPMDQIVKSWETNPDIWLDNQSIEYKFILNMHDSISELLYFNEKVAPYKVCSFNKAKEYFTNIVNITQLREKIKQIERFTYSEVKNISFVFEKESIDEVFLKNKNAYVEKLNNNYKISVNITNSIMKKLAPILYNSLEYFSKNEFELFVKSLFNYIFCFEVILNFKYLDKKLFVSDKGSKAAAKSLEKELKSYKDVNYAVEELQILSQSINKQTHAGKVVSLLGSIEIVNKETKQSVTDLDGLAFLINKTNISILISESKFHKRSSQTKASNQLEKRMKTLGIDVNVNKLDNGAWVVLDSGVI
ncbi:hypothetical protein [Aliarcobacter skirrowii]|uniref:hypothetical protein n=1 Tax=Aliarcobacter skirrowii TaxID=28200 RepID=UPI0008376146|nr:hypothetical protein [Aliarcobacter skirrowii]